jgi:hypothetical protein
VGPRDVQEFLEKGIPMPLLGIEVMFRGQPACKIFVITRLEHIVPITDGGVDMLSPTQS